VVDLEFRSVIEHVSATAEYLDAAYDRFNVLGTRIYFAYRSVIGVWGS